MTGIDCARFEADLAAVLAETGAADPARVAVLRAHARSCPACRGSEALLSIAEAPAALRDPIPEPSEETWTRLSRGIEAGIARERRRVRRVRWGTAAAAAAVVLLVVLVLRGPDPPPPTAEIPEDPGSPAAAWGGWGDFAFVPEAEEARPAALPGERMYPDVEALDEATRERLLRWLREEETRLSEGGPA